MDKIRAPYNFVPVSEKIWFPEWAANATQDVPFEDGVSGTFDIVVTAETPIVVRGAEDGGFFRTPEGRYAIPGSSLRGMLRNVLEIASFGKLRRFDDRRYGVRDLHNRDVYVDHMAAILYGRPTPLVSAGWLVKTRDAEEADDDGAEVARIEPCAFAKIEYALLDKLAQERGVMGFNPGRRQSAPDKYGAWERRRAPLDVDVTVQVTRGKGPGYKWVSDFGKVEQLGGTFQGRIVFTGQPSDYSQQRAPRKGAGRPKHHDFVFKKEPAGAPVVVTKARFSDFEFIHSDRGQRHGETEAPNAEWGHWKHAYDSGERVPVFFLLDERGALRSFGLAMMFRLAYTNTIGDAVRNAQAEHDDRRPDLAETLFGHVPEEHDGRRRGEATRDDGGEIALKGRVSFGLAMAAPEGVVPLPAVKAVLGAPKASYYPNYLEQSESADEPGGAPPRGVGAPKYMTLMGDPLGARHPRVRGWKRYRPQDAMLKPPIPAKASDKVITTFTPLPAGTTFRARVRVHNVKRVELGALLWALRFGGEAGCFHTLGMAKPLGFGRARIELDAAAFRCFDMEGRAVPAAGVNELEGAFVETMERWCERERIKGGWRESAQIDQLLACARPLSPGSGDGRHMMLDHPDYRNEFSEAKKDGLALAPAGSVAAWRQRLDARARSRATAPTRVGAVGVADADDVDRALLKRAYDQGRHVEVLKGWMREGGARETERQAIARAVVTFLSKDMKKNHADVIAWLTG